MMFLSVLYFMIIATHIDLFECRHHHHYNVKKFHRRQSQQNLQPPQQMLQPSLQMFQPQQQVSHPFNPLQQPIPQFPIAHPRYPSLAGLNRLPNENAGLSYGNPYAPSAIESDNAEVYPDNVPVPYNNFGVPPYNSRMPSDNDAVLSANVAMPFNKETALSEKEPLMDETESAFSDLVTSASSYSELVPLVPSHSDSVNIGSRRRRKNIGQNNDELQEFFEKGKKLLEVSTASDFLINNDVAKHKNHSVKNNVPDNNATLIPLPKGMQLKTVSKSDDSIIHSEVNISSSTQKIVSFDNNTEIENVVEMQMEKKIEDEKGADKGFEAVRIVETERIKPMVKWNTSRLHRRKKNHKRKLVSHHRSKRSNVVPDEDLHRSKFLNNKMAPKFFAFVKRKERVVEPNNLVNRHVIPYFQEQREKTTTESAKQLSDSTMYGKKEMGDFVKFFLKEMTKFRKFRVNKKNTSELLRRTCDECNSFKLLSRETKKKNKKLSLPEHMNVIMNLNMTFDSKNKDGVAESVRISKAYNTIGFGNTTSPPGEFNRILETRTPRDVNEKQISRFLTAVLFFSALTCLFTVSTLILPKLSKFLRIRRMNLAIKPYKLYDDYSRNRDKEMESENLLAEDYQQLEWQSENGDWLSEKESQFK